MIGRAGRCFRRRIYSSANVRTRVFSYNINEKSDHAYNHISGCSGCVLFGGCALMIWMLGGGGTPGAVVEEGVGVGSILTFCPRLPLLDRARLVKSCRVWCGCYNSAHT